MERLTLHPLYRKVIRRHKRYKAHDENNEAKIGDVVLIEEVPSDFQEKRWLVVDWVQRGEAV